MIRHADLLEWAGLYGLEALDDEERQAVERHLADGCDECRRAMEEGLARLPIDDFDEYTKQLQARFSASYRMITAITARAVKQPKRVAQLVGLLLRLCVSNRNIR